MSDLYDQHGGALYGFLLGAVHDKEKASMLLIKVFVQFFQENKNKKLASEKAFIPLLRIAIKFVKQTS